MQEQPSIVALKQSTLSPAELRRTLVFHTTSSPAQIRQDMASLRQLDKAAEHKQRVWTAVAVACLVVAVISLVIALATATAAMAVAVVLGVGGAIAGFTMRAIRGRLNLDDRRHELTSELVRYLATDIGPGGSLDLRIDFNSYRNRRYETGREGAATSYALPWLSLKGTLAQVVKRKERRKRKYVKVKEAFREKISLTILANAKRYSGLERVQGLIQRAQLPPGILLQGVSSDANRVVIRALTDCHRRVKGRGTTGATADQQTSSHYTMLGLFLACYDCLAQCRRRKGA
jgi:hypothetical protein